MYRRISAILLIVTTALLPGAAVRAQAPQEKLDTAAIESIKEEGLKRSEVMRILSYITDVTGARLTGSPNIRVAQEWAKQKLTEWGLANAHLEAWGPFGRGWSLEGFALNLTRPYFVPLIAYRKAWSPSTKGVLKGPLVLIDAQTEADLDKYKGKLKDAIVLLSGAREVKAHFTAEGRRLTDEELLKLANAEPPSAQGAAARFNATPEQRAAIQLLNKKWELIYAEKPALVLEPGRGDGGTIFVQSAQLTYPADTPNEQRKTIRDKDAPPIVPQVVVSVEHYNRIIRMLRNGAPVEIEANVKSKYYDQDLMSYNVIAEIPGTDLKEEIVMLGAHFDSWHSGTGATDNGAGSAVCLEAVRILQKLGLKPRR